MNEIIYINNIKERLFNHLNNQEFQILIIELLTLYKNNTSHLWYDIKYLNSCFEIFFTYFDRFKDPLTIFYTLFFNKLNNKNKLLHDFSKLNIKSKISYYLNIDSFINNDINVVENDFDLLSSILIYLDYIAVKDTVLFSGISLETDKGLSFKFKRKCR